MTRQMAFKFSMENALSMEGLYFSKVKLPSWPNYGKFIVLTGSEPLFNFLSICRVFSHKLIYEYSSIFVPNFQAVLSYIPSFFLLFSFLSRNLFSFIHVFVLFQKIQNFLSKFSTNLKAMVMLYLV